MVSNLQIMIESTLFKESERIFEVFLVGGEVIHSFAFAMIVGVIVGTYSSIFVASPVVIKMSKEN